MTSHTGISLSLWITSSCWGKTCAAARPAAPLAQVTGSVWRLIHFVCLYVYIYISQLQIESLRLWQPIAPQSSACHRTRSHLSVWSFVKIPTNTRMRAVSISIPRVAGWCLCSGVECDSPVETLQFYFRPSHTQWERSRNVSPFNYSFSGSCEILCICR